MVEHLQTDHRQIEVDGADIGRAFTDVVWYSERPIMRTAPAPLLRLAGLVRDTGIKVVLTGEGADEIFGGYNIFREDKARRFWAREPDSKWRPNLLSSLYGYIARDAKGEAFWRAFFRNGLENTSRPVLLAPHPLAEHGADEALLRGRPARADAERRAAVRRAGGLSRARSGPLASAVPRSIPRADALHVVLPAQLAGRSHDDGPLRRRARAVPRSSIDRAGRAHSAEVQAARAHREVHPQAELHRHSSGRHRAPTEAAVPGADRCLLRERSGEPGEPVVADEKRSSTTDSSMWTPCSGCCRRRAPPARRSASATRWRWRPLRRSSCCTISSSTDFQPARSRVAA